MASTRDIQDIMGMAPKGLKPAHKKKKKIVEAQPRLTGMSREVQALMGDSVPPIAITETSKVKARPSLAQKLMRPRHWEERTFQHGARSDGLLLKHWKVTLPVIGPTRPQEIKQDTDMSDTGSPNITTTFEKEYPMDKWNVKIQVPKYNEEQYENYYKAEDWSKEETDYLIRLVADYDVRWILVADRYDPSEIPSSSGEYGTTAYPPRTTEQLKARYYQMAAKDLELRIPASNMTQAEFKQFETMKNFDAKTEGLRKITAEKLFERTKEEAEEEKTLLEELHRITKHEDEFIAMRRDLYSRLEAAPSLRRNERGEEQNIVLSSAGLSELLNRLFAREKQRKGRPIAPGEQNVAQPTPVENRGRPVGTTNRKDTVETPTDASQKKGPVPPQIKQLKPEEEERFGISRPQERLTSGVHFRHDKINRITTAKSQVQTQKILATLTELEIPSRLSMPTEKVCKEFERLVAQITLLLDAKKNLTRVAEEVKILEEMKRQRLGLPAVLSAATDANTAAEAGDEPTQISTIEETQMTDANEGEPGPAIDDDDDEDADGDDETQAQTANDDEQVNEEEDEDDDEEAENDNEDEEENEEEDEEEEDEDGAGTAALIRGGNNEDDDDEEDEEDEEEDDEEEEEAAQRTSQDPKTFADSGEDDEEEEEEEEQDGEEEEEEEEREEEDEDNDDDDEGDETMHDASTTLHPEQTNDSEEQVTQQSRKRSASAVSLDSEAGSQLTGASRKRRK